MKETWITTVLCKSPGAVRGITAVKNGTLYFTACGALWKLNLKHPDNEPKQLVGDISTVMTSLVWDGKHTIYITDFNDRILAYSMKTDQVSVLAGNGQKGHKDGTLKNASFCDPWGITIDNDGNLFVAEWHYVRKINLSTGTVETLAGTSNGYDKGGHKDGDSKESVLSHPFGIVTDNNGSVYVAENGNCCVRKVKDGTVSTVAGIPGKKDMKDGILCDSQFQRMRAMLLDVDGTLLVADQNALRRVDVPRNLVSTPQQIKEPLSMTRDHEGNIYVGTATSILKLKNIWRTERFLWIGHLKEHWSYCPLARLPKDMIKEIASILNPVYERSPIRRHCLKKRRVARSK